MKLHIIIVWMVMFMFCLGSSQSDDNPLLNESLESASESDRQGGWGGDNPGDSVTTFTEHMGTVIHWQLPAGKSHTVEVLAKLYSKS